jgi:hypothetical protein
MKSRGQRMQIGKKQEAKVQKQGDEEPASRS